DAVGRGVEVEDAVGGGVVGLADRVVDEGVRSIAAGEGVGAKPASQAVIAVAAEKGIAIGAADQAVIAGPAIDLEAAVALVAAVEMQGVGGTERKARDGEALARGNIGVVEVQVVGVSGLELDLLDADEAGAAEAEAEAVVAVEDEDIVAIAAIGDIAWT